MKTHILSIDIGTSGAKVMMLNCEKHVLSSCSAPYPTLNPAPGAYEQDPQDWWKAVCEALKGLFAKEKVSPSQIGAIGVDGVSWTPVLLDGQGNVLTGSPLWYDTRSGSECREIASIIGKDAAFVCSRNPLQPYYEDSKISWFRRNKPEIITDCRHILTANGYIGYLLTGEMRQDLCQSYGWLFFDMEKGVWNEELAALTGFDLQLLPKLAGCSEVIGGVTASAAEATGLIPGTPVIAGGLDAACGALGAGVYAPGPVHEQSGSAGGMSICCDS